MVSLSRRGFLGGLLAVVSAPAIVRAESLMKLAPTEIIRPTMEDYVFVETRMNVPYGAIHIRPKWTEFVPGVPLTFDEYYERILAPMVNHLTQNVANAVMNGNGVARMTLEADGTGSLPNGARARIPVIAPVRLTDLFRETRGHQFA